VNRLVTALAILTMAGAARAASLWFVNDDAFISFRYAANLVRGLGLVYNPGERVEGFTNFLWTILVAGGMRMGWDPVAFSTGLGIIAYAASIALLVWFSHRRSAPATLWIPVAGILMILHHEAAVYATGGLETMFVTFLVTLALVLLASDETPRTLLLAGTAMVLAMMSRPDAVIFLGASSLFLAAASKERVRSLVLFLLPTTLLFVPYWAWRYSYYGFFFPNAFYAKSIALPYYSQGWTYTELFFGSYWVFLLLIPAGAAVALLAVRRGGTQSARELLAPGGGARTAALALLFVLAQTAFIIRIGGDFMFGRFFIPVVPSLALLAELVVVGIPARAWRLGAAAVVCASTLLRWDPFTEDARLGYIADEHRWYTSEHLAQSRRDGELLRRYFQGLPVKVAFWAGQVKMIYYADPYVATEASAGLTDTAIAHRPIAERGRPGHEKQATTDYLVGCGTNFLFGPFAPPPPGREVLDMVVFDSIAAKIVVYENAVMEGLARYPGVRFTPFPRYLDAYIARIDQVNPAQLSGDYAAFRSFYFLHNDDPGRERPFLERLGR
jgi:hypothetical protein